MYVLTILEIVARAYALMADYIVFCLKPQPFLRDFPSAARAGDAPLENAIVALRVFDRHVARGLKVGPAHCCSAISSYGTVPRLFFHHVIL